MKDEAMIAGARQSIRLSDSLKFALRHESRLNREDFGVSWSAIASDVMDLTSDGRDSLLHAMLSMMVQNVDTNRTRLEERPCLRTVQ